MRLSAITEAYTGQPGDILSLLSMGSIIIFNVQAGSASEIFDFRYLNTLAQIIILKTYMNTYYKRADVLYKASAFNFSYFMQELEHACIIRTVYLMIFLF